MGVLQYSGGSCHGDWSHLKKPLRETRGGSGASYGEESGSVFMFAILSLVVAMVACSGIESQVVGRWVGDDAGREPAVEFFSDGTISWHGGCGNWVVLEDGRIKVEVLAKAVFVFRLEEAEAGKSYLVTEDRPGPEFRLVREP